MGRILYGVQADGRGHLNRARTIVKSMPNHEFVFVGGAMIDELREEGYQVETVPDLPTFYDDNRVNNWRTLWHGLQVLGNRSSSVNRVAELIKHFDPHLILSDYEYFTAAAARKASRPWASLDNQHMISHCSYQRPQGQFLNMMTTVKVIQGLFGNPDRILIVSFVNLPPKGRKTIEVFEPIIRREITEQTPSTGDHVLIYQTSPTFKRLFRTLEGMDSFFKIYGLDHARSRNNLLFKKRSPAEFTEDLASCRYAIVNGGHNVICEALYLGKPVLCFPIQNHFEQFFNAYMVNLLGYGSYSLDQNPSRNVFDSFEARLNEFATKIKKGSFYGNDKIIQRIEELIKSS